MSVPHARDQAGEGKGAGQLCLTRIQRVRAAACCRSWLTLARATPVYTCHECLQRRGLMPVSGMYGAGHDGSQAGAASSTYVKPSGLKAGSGTSKRQPLAGPKYGASGPSNNSKVCGAPACLPARGLC